MGWNGYFTYAGTEIINVARTERYMEALGTSWFKPVFKADSLHLALGDKQYGTPLTDVAPWVDPDLTESTEFYGVYPINVSGLEDSTREASVTQSTRDGGAVGRTRYATREAVFSAVLMGETEQAVEYGFRWLKRALSGDPCNGISQSRGAVMQYLVAEPVILFDEAALVPDEPILAVLDGDSPSRNGGLVLDGGGVADGDVEQLLDGGDAGSSASIITPPYPPPFFSTPPPDPTECLPPLVRRLNRVTTTNGPSITGKRTATDKMHIWLVQWTITAADPHEYTLPRPVFNGYGDPLAPPTVVDGVQFFPSSTGESVQITDPACPTPIWTPVYDPECPPLLAPPPPPDVALGCWTPPTVWRRWWITTPRNEVPRWDVVTPVLDVYASEVDLRGLRVRFYPDNGLSPADSVASCDFDFDFVITYLPRGYRLRIDAATESITATDVDGITRSAGSLVMGSDGKPFTWPSLSCDQPYVVVFDLAFSSVSTKPITGMSLVTKVAA